MCTDYLVAFIIIAVICLLLLAAIKFFGIFGGLAGGVILVAILFVMSIAFGDPYR